MIICNKCGFVISEPQEEVKVNEKAVTEKSRHKKSSLKEELSVRYGEAMQLLRKNPERSKPSKRTTYYSVPRWERNSYLKEKANGFWRMDKEDRINIHKFNKRYSKKNNK